MSEDAECICEGNWRNIIKESEPLFDKIYISEKGEDHKFIGVMHAHDDYYYCMLNPEGKIEMLSCVGSLATFGYEIKP